MFYMGEAIAWCDQLNEAFDNAMMGELSGRYHGVLWRDGKHELYCMGGEL